MGKSQHSSTEQLNGKENDVWELLEPKEIHYLIQPNIYQLLSSVKWQERKDALDFLFGILSDSKRLADDSRHKQLVSKLGMV